MEMLLNNMNMNMNISFCNLSNFHNLNSVKFYFDFNREFLK